MPRIRLKAVDLAALDSASGGLTMHLAQTQMIAASHAQNAHLIPTVGDISTPTASTTNHQAPIFLNGPVLDTHLLPAPPAPVTTPTAVRPVPVQTVAPTAPANPLTALMRQTNAQMSQFSSALNGLFGSRSSAPQQSSLMRDSGFDRGFGGDFGRSYGGDFGGDFGGGYGGGDFGGYGGGDFGGGDC